MEHSPEKENTKANQALSEDFDYFTAYADAHAGKIRKKAKRRGKKSEEVASAIDPEYRYEDTPIAKRARERKRKRRVIATVAICAAFLAAMAVFIIIERPWVVVLETPEPEIPMLETRPERAVVSDIYIYGTRLNMTGTLPEGYEKQEGRLLGVDFVLYDGEFIEVPVEVNEGTFTLSKYHNKGLQLDGIPVGEHAAFIRTAYYKPAACETSEAVPDLFDKDDENAKETLRPIQAVKPKKEEMPSLSGDEELIYRYYPIDNASDYPVTTYYTLSNYNNRIVIDTGTDYSTMRFSVTKNTETEVYDIVLDAAHGGYDIGMVSAGGVRETDFLLPLTLKLKDYLEEGGMKVALTRDNEEFVDAYGPDGRMARAGKTRAKYMLSLNISSLDGGLEIYAADGLDYELAKLLSDNIKGATGLGNCGGNAYMREQNIFSRNFTARDIEETVAQNKEDGQIPYEPTIKSGYYYLIRESGGIVTGAYRDDRNGIGKSNPYCYTNTGIETYILELGSMGSESDVKLMQSKMPEYAKAIADAMLRSFDTVIVGDETSEKDEAAEGEAVGETGSDAEAEPESGTSETEPDQTGTD
jgi:N-acetylmuramoyl-L-alanine amidase